MALNYSFFDYLIRRFTPRTLYIANGANWLYDNLEQLKSDFPALRVANQVYDHEVGWIGRYNPALARCIEAHIGVNDKVCQAYAGHKVPPDHIYLINHGVDTEECDPARYNEADRRALKTHFGLPLERRIVTFLARLHPQKRPLDFIELARQCATDTSLFFLMVGDGPLGQQVDQELRRIGLDNLVRRSFYQPGRDIYAISDVVLLPSEHEGLPLAILESLSMGTAVVATDVGNIAEVLQTTGGGQIVSEIGHVGALRQALYAVLQNPPDGAAVRAATIEHYALEKIAKQNYEALLGEPYA
jgi:glycosyltransferase involved in cell wall biosynthesis